MFEDITKEALAYHAEPQPGKTSTAITKPTSSQRDLALAYTPGVAEPVRAIALDPAAANLYTNKQNLVGVITDGTAVLGLGNVGPLASKPVMEGKAVLFKCFADIDVFDIEVDAKTTEEFVETVTRIAPTFGGINLEDIKAPGCFEIEKELQARLNIPVFHDDQHGTAIIIAAGLLNALEIAGKKLEDAKIVCVGAGAAGIASMNLLLSLGAQQKNLLMVDSQGVVHSGRDNLNQYKQAFAHVTKCRTLADAMHDADIFIGVSGPNILTAEMLQTMAPNPIVFALSNPDPEIMPSLALATRDDLIMATGRSDYPNQVNNVLGFPFIFRGALDVQATCINIEMQKAAVTALAQLAKEPIPEAVIAAYSGLQEAEVSFGPKYILPKPLDPRLKETVSNAVAKAAVASGVALKKTRG